MSRIRNEEWLDKAKKCAINQQSRVVHGHEGDAAMVVGNTPDRWWCYCQRCKAGAVEMKSHVLLVQSEPPQSRVLTIPGDAKRVSELVEYQREFLAKFLASKHMDFGYLPTGVVWSESRHRLLVPTHKLLLASGLFHTEYMGRDTSGRSPEKWLTYNGQHYVGNVKHGKRAVVVEDLFSYYKVQWALAKAGTPVDVFCTLGTAIHDKLFMLMLKNYEAVASFYDGDFAGHKGSATNLTRLRAAGIGVPVGGVDACAPDGLDPKDMEINAIQLHVRNIFY